MVVETRSRKLKPDPTSRAKKESSDPSAQSSSEVDNQTAEELLARQQLSHDKFIQDQRTTAAQERSLVAEPVQSGIQTAMDQIAGCAERVLERTTQSSLLLEVEDLKKQLGSEKIQHKDLKVEYDKLVRDSESQKKNLDKVCARLDETSAESDRLFRLLNDCGLGDAYSTTDDYVKREWASIAYSITCLAFMLNGDSSGNPLDDEVTQRLRRVSKDHRKHIQDPALCRLLMEGYLWILIQDVVFDSKQSIWGGPGVEMLRVTQDRLMELIGEMGSDWKADWEPIWMAESMSAAYMAAWLARGSRVMSKLYEKDGVNIEHVVDVEAKRLQPFMVDQEPECGRVDEMVSEQLKDLIDSAAKLHQTMMGSRAIYRRHWEELFSSQESGDSGQWNPDVMEDKPWKYKVSPESRVLFRISPILYKFGRADGIQYDRHVVVVKGKVVVCD